MKQTILAAVLLICAMAVQASPSADDIAAYKVRLQIYAAAKQTPEDIAILLGNWFGRQGNFQASYNTDGTVIIQYVEGQLNAAGTYEIRFMAPVAKLKPSYEVIE